MVEDQTATILKYPFLKRFLPLRVILRRVDNEYKGIIEESFSMGVSSEYVRLWWSGRAYSFLGEITLDACKDASYNCHHADDVIYNPLSNDCPVVIDFDVWEKATDKFGKRNPPFKLKV